MPYLIVNLLLILVSSHKTKSEEDNMCKLLIVISERLPSGVEIIYKPASGFSLLKRSVINCILKLFSINILLKNINIFIIIFVSLFVISCETTQTSTKTVEYKSLKKIVKTDDIIKTTVENTLEKEELIVEPSVENKILKVGIMLPLSGKHYQIGNSLLNASQLALNKTQNKKIKFYVKDTGNENKIIINFYELLNEKVDIILGPLFSETINKIHPLIVGEDIQLITFSNNSNVARKNLYIFGLTLEDEIDTLLSYAVSKDYQNFAAILPKNSYGSRIKNEMIKFHSKNSSKLIKSIMYETENPDFYEISKNISNYEQRKINLNLKIEELKSKNTEESIRELKQLKNLDTYGDLTFDSLFIGVENFQQLSMISSILPYYDVDPKKIQYLGNSVWDKDAIIKEPGLNNSLFTSYDREGVLEFESEYINHFNQNPHPIASLAYDAVGLLVALHNKNIKINALTLSNKDGFVGINGLFKFNLDGQIDREPTIYHVKNEKLFKKNN